jgi:serine phosphatase RsbU (regulator of sigma subunit)
MGDESGVLSELLRAADSGPADGLGWLIEEALRKIGAKNAVLYILDYERRALQPVPGSSEIGGRLPGALNVRDSEAGNACSEIQTVEGNGRLWVPVTQRADCLGVIEIEIENPDEVARRACADCGILVGHLLVTAHTYTDIYELLSRRQNMSLPAEMHWEVQPSTNYVGPAVAVAGEIEPAYEVGGDAFDYSVNKGVVDFTLLDAMGHGLEAALLSTQALGAYRWARRQGHQLIGMARVLEKTFIEQFDGEKFVTGLLCRLDWRTGTFRWLNAGHLAPLLMKEGRIVEELETPPRCPLGLGLPDEFAVHRIDLVPGDKVVLYSDGVVEARSPNGEDFEIERLYDSLERSVARNNHAAVAVRDVINEVKAHSSGPLRDDATIVLLEYRGPD